MIKIILVCLFFVYSEGEVKTHTVHREMSSMEECLAAKHQVEFFPPPPPAFHQGFYCQKMRDI